MEKFIDDDSAKQLTELFEKELENEVDIHLYLGDQPNDFGKFTNQLLDELAELDKRIKIKVLENIEGMENLFPISPVIWIGKDLGHKILYWGAPYQHEFNGLINIITMVSQNKTDIPEDLVNKIKNLEKDVLIHIFVTPQCPYCPYSVVNGAKIAMESEGKVTSICVEAQENQEISMKFDVSSVPQQVINKDHDSITVGVQDIKTFSEQVIQYGGAREQSESVKEEPSKINLTVFKPDEIKQLLETHPKTIAIFTGDDCEKCEGVRETLQGLIGELEEHVKIIEIDMGTDREIPGFKNLDMIPTVISFKNKEEHNRWMGSLPPPVLKKKIQEFSEDKNE